MDTIKVVIDQVGCLNMLRHRALFSRCRFFPFTYPSELWLVIVHPPTVQEAGSLSVWNNGAGIPVVVHKEHQIYVPELIFGNLLTGTLKSSSGKCVAKLIYSTIAPGCVASCRKQLRRRYEEDHRW